MKKSRSVLEAEQLEGRQLLDASLWLGEGAVRAPLAPDSPAEVFLPPDLSSAPSDQTRTEAASGAALPPGDLELFFAQPGELKKLFAQGPAVSAEEGRAGCRFLRCYAEKAIRNFEARYGPLLDREDLGHQVFVEWWEQVGADDQALVNVLDGGSPERQVLRQVVPRVLSRARYEQGKLARMVERDDLPARAETQEWTDLRLDLESGVGNLEARERLLLDLRREGKTFEEIGPELGTSKQRASEWCQAVVGRLNGLYVEQP